MSDYERFAKALESGEVPERFLVLLMQCYQNYMSAVRDLPEKELSTIEMMFIQYLDLIVEQCVHPYQFEPYHSKIRKPFDFQEYGLRFIHHLIVKERSEVYGKDNLEIIADRINAGENCILLANHQIEPDPQVIYTLLHETYPQLADEIIFVAGERVLTDPMAVPFSLGCNLLCIYSKKHIENPPELKAEKLKHNQKTMQKMSELLRSGGRFIYVAPSGGRDREGPNGQIDVSPFDPGSIEMFWLMAQKAKTKTHFHPLALKTHDILPPPRNVGGDLGEERRAGRHAVFLHFGKEIDMERYPGSEEKDKKLRREHRAKTVWKMVNDMYHAFPPV